MGVSRSLKLDATAMLGIQADTPLEVSVLPSGLHLARADGGIGPEKLDAILSDIRAQYGPALKRLAE